MSRSELQRTAAVSIRLKPRQDLQPLCEQALSIHSFHRVGLIGSIIGAWVLLLLLRLTKLEPGRRRS